MEDRRTLSPSMLLLGVSLMLLSLANLVHSNDSMPAPLEDAEEKRAQKQYNFGLGKREYTLGDDFGADDYDSFEKRQDRNRYNFGLGKRFDRQRYNFGLGKRDRSRFNFGLGKREQDYEDFIKRRYSFGLGKRSAGSSYPSYAELGRRKRSPAAIDDASVFVR